MDDSSSKPLTADQLSGTPAITTLGLLASRLLQQHGQVTFQLLATSAVVVVPVGELELDSLPEPEALQRLVQEGYTDQQLAAFLEARDVRLSRNRLPAPDALLVATSPGDDHR